MKFSSFAVIFMLILHANGNLNNKLRNYDLIDNIHVHSYSRRDVSEKRVTKQVSLSAFGKNITLELTPSRDLFSKNFKITVIHGDDSTETLEGFDKHNFFTGHVAGEPGSSASIHMEGDQLMTGMFTAGGEEYTIEPVSNLADEGSGNYSETTMVAYRRYDIVSDPDNVHQCGSYHADEEDGADIESVDFQPLESDHHRVRRATGNKICKIAAVADYKYFNHMGKGNLFTTANYVANIINRVNLIYKSTGFHDGTGYGFELDAMAIHDSPSTSATSYNRQRTNWGTTELLQAFGKKADYKDLCLSHLFTSESMPDSVLGLAYIASSRAGSVGGVCSPTRTYSGVTQVYNIGWSSSKNGAGNTVTFTQQALVTAHEFGHNWGSEHDPTGGDCAPGTILDDGKYLMYAYSVTGEDPNNDLFSSCSKNYMNSVIRAKASGCFSESTPYNPCGNGRIEGEEECDGGFLGSVGLDPCCSSSCTLNQGASCSAANFPCCVNCQLASTNVQCLSDIEGSCKAAQNCDGVNFNCPEAPNKPDRTECIDSGLCFNGVCQSFCEARGFNSCACSSVDNSCKRCCRSGGGACGPFEQSGQTFLLSDGTSCVQGYCSNGNCVKVATDLVERFWEFIDEISFNAIVESFRTNMVACVTGFSLVLYIPICIVIWCIDKKRKRDWKKENSVHIRTDRGLAHDEDRRPVVNPDQSRATRSRPSTLDASDLMDSSSYRRPNSRNAIQPLGEKPRSSRA